jgi:hypothetical protein
MRRGKTRTLGLTVRRLCLTDRSIDALRASAGQVITGVFVTEPRNRNLGQAPGILAIALSNGTVLNIYPTSTARQEDLPYEYFRLDVEPSTSPLPMEYSRRDPVRWTVADQLMRALVGKSIVDVQIVREVEDDEDIDIGIRVVSSSASLYVTAERASLPMTLAIELDGEVITQ